MKLNTGTLEVLARGMDVRLARHQALSANLANLDTPGFSAVDVDVPASMAGSGPGAPVASTSALHLPGGSAGTTVVSADATAKGLDGNQVDLDSVMARLAENALEYQANARVTSRHLALLRYAASDGTA